MGTTLQTMHLSDADFGDRNGSVATPWSQQARSGHGCASCLPQAGADVIETDSFRSNRITLVDYGLQDRVIELNQAAASLARRAADEYFTADQPRFVAGSMGPSGKLISTNDPEMSDISFDELADVFREQAVGLIRGGVDLLLIETSNDILEVKAAINGIHRAFEDEGVQLPIQAQVTLDTNGKMLLGTDVSAVSAILEGMAVDVIGLNCSTGPEHMRESIEYLTSHSRLPISCIPNAGLPLNIEGEAVYPMKADEFSRELGDYVQNMGVRMWAAAAEQAGTHRRLVKKVRRRSEKPVPEPQAMLASPVQAVQIKQSPPFIIGERMNAQGSRAFKRCCWQRILTPSCRWRRIS